MIKNIKETQKQVKLLEVQATRAALESRSQSNRIVKVRRSIMVDPLHLEN